MRAIETYLEAWNAGSSQDRHNLLERCLTTDVVYIDPHAPEVIQGIEAMEAMIETFRARFDHKLIAEGAIDAHHDVFRLQWRLQQDGGGILSHGLMVGEVDDSGIITRIVQFVDANN
ncbi:MAG: nuclear transport factor 2 family protein [Cyanobacteria bacterium P01_E01_bin.34]